MTFSQLMLGRQSPSLRAFTVTSQTARAFTERLSAAGVSASVGTVRDAYRQRPSRSR